jgi:hypothetical protein
MRFLIRFLILIHHIDHLRLSRKITKRRNSKWLPPKCKVDRHRVSELRLADLNLSEHHSIKVKVGVKENAEPGFGRVKRHDFVRC